MMRRVKPSIIPAALEQPAEGMTPWSALGRRLLLQALRRLTDGEIRLIEPNGAEHRFGHRTARCSLSVTVHVRNPQFYVDTAFGGSVGGGESYIHGHWRCDDLTALIRIMVLNRAVQGAMEGRVARLTRPLLKLFHWIHRNSKTGSARNIAAHYDLGNEMYRLMLDETMAYSCGIFEHADSTLEQASRAKFDSVCRKLALGPNDHLLEIGTGWGGLAIHAAQHYGCRVTTTTISKAQHEVAGERIGAAGLSDRITLLLEDYRDLRGRFDKLVSIEMIEAVGAKYLDTYFHKCSELLHSGGAMLLQAITIRDQVYRSALRSVDYIQRFIFPGSFIPSLTALTRSIARVTDLKIFNLEDIGPHYARTLELWRHNFLKHTAEVRLLGYPEHFIRQWEYYLCYCEGGFAERQLGDVQLLLTKPDCRLPAIATV